MTYEKLCPLIFCEDFVFTKLPARQSLKDLGF